MNVDHQTAIFGWSSSSRIFQNHFKRGMGPVRLGKSLCHGLVYIYNPWKWYICNPVKLGGEYCEV